MKYLQFALAGWLLGTSAAWAVDKFVTPDKLPTVPKQQRPAVQPTDELPTQVCQCGCGKTDCQCGRTMSSCADPVQFDEAALKHVMEAKPMASVPVRRTQCLVFTMPGCIPCLEDASSREPWLNKSGWIENKTVTAHFRKVDIYEHPAIATQFGVTSCPTYIITNDGQPVFKHTGSTPKETLVRDFIAASKMVTARPEVGAIGVGKVKREQVALVRKLLGKAGSIQLGNEPIEHKANSVTLKVPANLKVAWSTDAAGKLHVESTPPLKVQWGILNQEVKSADVADKRIDLSLPWAPDAMLEIED